MLKYTDYDIVFQEIPEEVTLAINISNCPHNCKGCHSPQLMQDIGEPLNEKVLNTLLNKYGNSITCICFMGGDLFPQYIESLAGYIRKKEQGRIKTAWYSGRDKLLINCNLNKFNYIKLGPYIEKLGGLNMKTTNQRLYKIKGVELEDITSKMQV